MKIKTTKYGFIHYYAECKDCNFDAAINTDKCSDAQAVRNATLYHVEKTGHTVIVSAGKETKYSKHEVNSGEAAKEEG